MPGKCVSESPYLHSTRWKIAYLGLLNGFVMSIFRININMVLPCMVVSKFDDVRTAVNGSYDVSSNLTYEIGQGSDDVEECPEIAWTEKGKSKVAEFDWDRKTQSYVLSSYYYGFLACQVVFGWVASRTGGKRLLTVTAAMSTLLTLLVPVLTRASVYALMAVRAAIGVLGGASNPAWYQILYRWALPHERSRFTGICWLGQYLGTIIGYFTSGFLCVKGFDNGWGSVFYIHGMVGVVFTILWQYGVTEYPEVHPRISEGERQLLATRSITTVDQNSEKTKVKIPWLKMLTHVPVLVCFVTHICDSFLYYLVLICLPLYLKNVLRFDIQSNGVFSSLPFISSAFGLALSGILADHVIRRKLLTVTATRKLVQVTALLGAAGCICVPGFLQCSQRAWVIVVLCVGMFCQALGYSSGFPASEIDIAPRFSSVIFGISNTLCTLSGVIAPFTVALLTTHDTIEEWRVLFLIATGCAVVGALVFGLFSSSERAPWAAEPDKEITVTIETTELLDAMKPLVIENGTVIDQT